MGFKWVERGVSAVEDYPVLGIKTRVTIKSDDAAFVSAMSSHDNLWCLFFAFGFAQDRG